LLVYEAKQSMKPSKVLKPSKVFKPGITV